ncbi:MAG TPA: type II toxin-antitoxin system prevent-host-death family antitoxin [Terriglobales bacterium]|jgi:antitoxin (DNA-binding transcriptional repressor) of toxin-antitoxin stability system
MAINISATEANRKFSAILRGVRAGKRYVIISRGVPVAEIHASQGASAKEVARRRKAWEKLKQDLMAQPVRDLPHITRDEMNER